MDNEIITLIKQAGFTEKEARIYLALLELGQADVTDIAKKATLKRSIVYVIIDELIEKGYASMLPNRRINTYQAIDPGVILTQLKSVAKNLAEMLPYLRSLQNKSGACPKIHFIDTLEGITKVYEEMNEYDNQFFISSYCRIEEVFPGTIADWIYKYKKKIFKQFISRHLVPDNSGEREIAKEFSRIGQDVRFSKELIGMKMDFSIYGNKLGITSLEEKPFIVVIESGSLVNSLMPIFEMAWRNGKKI
jgi:sugar-specific transcriptional regulator TrmB